MHIYISILITARQLKIFGQPEIHFYSFDNTCRGYTVFAFVWNDEWHFTFIPVHKRECLLTATETVVVIVHIDVSRWRAVIMFERFSEVSRGSREHSHLCVCGWGVWEGACMCVGKRCLYLTWGSHWLPVNWVSSATRGEPCEWRENTGKKEVGEQKAPMRHFCLSWDIWRRSCETILSVHVEGAMFSHPRQ